VPTRDTPVNLDDSIYALVPVAAASAAEENNTTLIDTLRIDTHNNTKIRPLHWRPTMKTRICRRHIDSGRVLKSLR